MFMRKTYTMLLTEVVRNPAIIVECYSDEWNIEFFIGIPAIGDPNTLNAVSFFDIHSCGVLIHGNGFAKAQRHRASVIPPMVRLNAKVESDIEEDVDIMPGMCSVLSEIAVEYPERIVLS